MTHEAVEAHDVFEAVELHEDLMLSEVMHPEFHGLSDLERICVLLDRASHRFYERRRYHLAGLCDLAADELRRADGDDAFVRRVYSAGGPT